MTCCNEEDIENRAIKKAGSVPVKKSGVDEKRWDWFKFNAGWGDEFKFWMSADMTLYDRRSDGEREVGGALEYA